MQRSVMLEFYGFSSIFAEPYLSAKSVNRPKEVTIAITIWWAGDNNVPLSKQESMFTEALVCSAPAC